MNNKKPHFIILGSTGQLGLSFAKLTQNPTLLSRQEIDLSLEDQDFSDLKNKIKHNSIVINCAAYTDVNLAEIEFEKASLINHLAVERLANICKEANIPLIHYSTDYVYDGEGKRPYQESDHTLPINNYGQSKLKGDKAILDTCSKFLIVRTSWIFSEFGNNFVKKISEKIIIGENLQIVDDQIGCPTYATNLANITLLMINKDIPTIKPGIYNVTSSNSTSWWKLAIGIQNWLYKNNIIHKKVDIFPISSSGFSTSVKRPNYSALSTHKLSTIDVNTQTWQVSLNKCLSEMYLKK